LLAVRKREQAAEVIKGKGSSAVRSRASVPAAAVLLLGAAARSQGRIDIAYESPDWLELSNHQVHSRSLVLRQLHSCLAVSLPSYFQGFTHILDVTFRLSILACLDGARVI
jgi:hypothetical protein